MLCRNTGDCRQDGSAQGSAAELERITAGLEVSVPCDVSQSQQAGAEHLQIEVGKVLVTAPELTTPLVSKDQAAILISIHHTIPGKPACAFT